jgi:hypothetical protein
MILLEDWKKHSMRLAAITKNIIYGITDAGYYRELSRANIFLTLKERENLLKEREKQVKRGSIDLSPNAAQLALLKNLTFVTLTPSDDVMAITDSIRNFRGKLTWKFVESLRSFLRGLSALIHGIYLYNL